MLHDCDWELVPEHPAPPPEGVGLLQLRMRVCDPPSHVWLQLPQAPHSDQLPSTVDENENFDKLCEENYLNISMFYPCFLRFVLNFNKQREETLVANCN